METEEILATAKRDRELLHCHKDIEIQHVITSIALPIFLAYYEFVENGGKYCFKL
jgi:hypothetical protein